MQKISSRSFIRITLVSAAIVAAGSGATALAFTEPAVAPPGSNVPAPINVGAAAQTKGGALTVSGALLGGSTITSTGLFRALANIQVPCTWNLCGSNTVNLNGNQVWNSGGGLILQWSGTANSNVYVGNTTGGAGNPQSLYVETGNLNVGNTGTNFQICLNGRDAAHCTTDIVSGGTNFWAGSLTGNINNANTGNVGIGTTNPGAKLDVSGNVRIGGGVNPRLYLSSTDATVSPRVMDISGRDWRFYREGGAEGSQVFMIIKPDGSTGLGGSAGGVAPAASSLTVDNTAHTMQICLNGTDAAHCTTDITGGTNHWTLAGSSLYPNQTTYNVGVGTNAPSASYKLDVAGDVHTSSNIYQENAKGLFAENVAGVSQQWMWPRWTNDWMYTNMAPNGWIIRDNASVEVMRITAAGDISAKNRFSLGAVTSGVRDDSVSSSPYSRVNADSFRTNGIGAGQMFIEGDSIDANLPIRIGAGLAGGQLAQSVGVGTSAALPVKTFAVDNAAHDMQICLNGTAPTNCVTSLTGGTNFWTGSLTGNINNANTGNVGIGIATPVQKLDVNGVSKAAGFEVGGGVGGYIGFNAYYNSGWIYRGSDYGYVIRHNGADLGFWTAPTGIAGTASAMTQRMTLTAAGSVGIANTAPPANSLAIGVTGGNHQICLNGICTTTLGGTNYWTLTGTQLSNNAGDNVKVWNQNTSAGYLQLNSGAAGNAGYIAWHMPGGTRIGYMGWDSTNINLNLENSANFAITNGNVGIGTANPGNRLTVRTPGGSSPVGAMSVDVDTFGTPANAAASYFFRVRDIGGGYTPFQIQGNGSVGIANTAPPANSLAVGVTGGNHQICLNGICTSTLGGTNYFSLGQTWGANDTLYNNTGSVIRAQQPAAGATSAGNGSASLVAGNTTQAGYVEWHRPNGQRMGYMGWNPTNVNLNLENSANFVVTGGDVGIGNTAPPANSLAVGVTGGNHQICLNGICTGTLGGTNYWTLNGTNLYNNSGTNVGIGVSAPDQKLEVAGTILADTASGDPGIFIRKGDGAGAAGTSFGLINTGNNRLAIGPSTGTGGLTGFSERVSILNSGSVGIANTAPPANSLAVGVTGGNHQICLNGICTSTLGGTNYFSLGQTWGANDTLYNNTGSVIRAQQPAAGATSAGNGSASLVAGNTTQAGYVEWHRPNGQRMGYMGWNPTNVNLNLENSANFAITGGNVTASGNITTNATSYANQFCFNAGGCITSVPSGDYLPLAGGTMNANATIDNANRMNLAAQEDIYLLARGGDVFVSSAWGGAGNLTVSGELTANTVVSNTWLYVNGLNGIHWNAFNSSLQMTDANWIRTTGAGLLSNKAGALTVGAANSYAFAAGNGGSQDLTIGSDASYSYIQSWNAKPLQINKQGNNVGIGKAPSYKLDVGTGEVNSNDGYCTNGVCGISTTFEVSGPLVFYGTYVAYPSTEGSGTIECNIYRKEFYNVTVLEGIITAKAGTGRYAYYQESLDMGATTGCTDNYGG